MPVLVVWCSLVWLAAGLGSLVYLGADLCSWCRLVQIGLDWSSLMLIGAACCRMACSDAGWCTFVQIGADWCRFRQISSSESLFATLVHVVAGWYRFV